MPLLLEIISETTKEKLQDKFNVKFSMPVHKVNGGYRWGSIPKKPTTKKHAQEIAKAAHANGYKSKSKKK